MLPGLLRLAQADCGGLVWTGESASEAEGRRFGLTATVTATKTTTSALAQP